MFRVTTVQLSVDASTVDSTLLPTDMGELSRDEVLALLNRFRTVDGRQAGDADPQLVITARAGKFIVRPGRNQLFLYNARDNAAPYAELEPAEMVSYLEQESPEAAAAANRQAEASAGSAGRAAPHKGIAVTILAVGLALNGYTLYSVFYSESVNEAPVVTLLTDPAEIAVRLNATTGTFATGTKNGDRTITVSSDGKIKFSEIGSRNSVVNNTDTFRVGRREKKFCLTTTESGIVDIFDNDTLIYYRDRYRRQ